MKVDALGYVVPFLENMQVYTVNTVVDHFVNV